MPGFKFREYSLGEIDALQVQIDAGRPDSNTEAYVFHEMVRCSADMLYWANRYAYVWTDKGKVQRVTVWDSQKMLLQKIAEKEEENPWGHVLIAALKGRQEGITTISQMIQGHRLFMHEGTRALAASNVEQKTFDLYLFMDRMYNRLPEWMQPGIADRVKSQHMIWPKLHTKVNYAWSNQADPIGQGQTLDIVHLTEVSTWQSPGYISGDILPAFMSSGTYLPIFIAESTGNGAKGNYFADMYMGAKRGGDVIPLFISIFDLPSKYFRNAEGVEFSLSTLGVAARWTRETGKSLSREQLAWYQLTRERYESTGELETFFQEYPTTEEEAFQTGMKSVFSLETRSKLRDGVKTPEIVYDVNHETGKLRPAKDPEGDHFNKLVMWEYPKRGDIYVVGVDGSWGLGGDADASAIEVLRVGTKERPDEQVAEYFGEANPSELANIAYTIGNIFSDGVENFPAMMSCEANHGSPSAITQEALIKKGYPHFYTWKKDARRPGEGNTQILGWYTNASSRPGLTQTGVEALKGMDLLINSRQVLKEMGTYVAHSKRFGLTNVKYLAHADNEHDDCLMALFIAYYTAHERDLSIVADERRKYLKISEEERGPLDPMLYDVGQTFADHWGDRWDPFI